MAVLELEGSLKGRMTMNADQAKRFNGFNGTSKPKKAKVCVHGRMVEYHYDDEGQATGNVVCRECWAVIPDPANVLREKLSPSNSCKGSIISESPKLQG